MCQFLITDKVVFGAIYSSNVVYTKTIIIIIHHSVVVDI